MNRLLCAALLLSAGLSARNISGSLSGAVQDSTGSVIPGMEVTISSDRSPRRVQLAMRLTF